MVLIVKNKLHPHPVFYFLFFCSQIWTKNLFVCKHMDTAQNLFKWSYTEEILHLFDPYMVQRLNLLYKYNHY